MTGVPTHAVSKEKVLCTLAINYCLKSKVSFMPHCLLCSTHYIALHNKKCLKSTSTHYKQDG